MPYQAGQAYVQVVPSLRGFVRQIRRDVKQQLGPNPPQIPVEPDADWGPVKRQATKEGAEAGGGFAKAFRTRVEAALRNLRDVEIGADTSEADLEIAGLRTRLQALRDVRIGVDMDADEAHREIEQISAQLHRIAGEDARIDVQVDASKASAELATLKRRVEVLDGEDVEIDVHVDRDGMARSNIAAVGRSMSGLILAGALLAPAFLPGLALVTTAAGGLAAGFAGASAGVGAFALAAAPAITQVAEALKAQEQALASPESEAALRKLAAAMGALTPLQRRLMEGWIGLRDAYNEWSEALQPAVIPVLISGMGLLQQVLPLVTPLVKATADAFGTLLDSAAKALGSPFWQNFFDFLARTATPSIVAFGQIFGNLAVVFANLLMAFEPFAAQFLGWLVRLTEKWAEWSAELSESEGFRAFLQYIAENGPKLAAFFDSLWRALQNVARALAPLSGPLLDGLTAVLNFVAGLPPPVLAGIAAGFLAIGFSLAIMNGVIAALAANPIILVIAALAGLAVGFYVAYQRSEKFRDVVDGVFAKVREAALYMWNNGLKEVFEELVRLWEEVVAPALKWLWRNVIQPIFKLLVWLLTKVVAPVITWIWRNITRPIITAIIEIFKFFGRILNWLWKNVVKPVFKFIGDAFGVLGRFFRKIWNDYLFPVFDLLGAIVKLVWRGTIRPIFEGLKTGFRAVGRAFRWVWNNVLKPVAEAFGNFWNKHVQPKVDKFFGWFGRAWEKVGDTVKRWINWVIDNIINDGLIKAFNALADFFGTKKMADVPLIGQGGRAPTHRPASGRGRGKRAMEGLGFESGGIIPGTRTVHDSVFIHARPRESVMVPEFTDQVGGERGIHALNRMAERGQLRALLGDHSEGFQGGGVVGYKGHTFTQAMVDRIKNAEKIAGYAFRIFQGGFRPWTSYSKGTHGKDAIDYGPVRSSAVNAARKAGIVAWDRTGKGNWAPHIHGIPVPGGGVQLSSSARGQYEDYLSGGDGLGGRDTGIKVAGGGAGGGFELPGWISKIFEAPLGWLKGIFNAGVDKFRNKFGDSQIVNMLLAIPRKLSRAVKGFFENTFGGSAAESGFAVAGKSRNAAITFAQSQMGRFGWGSDQMRALVELWERESNWRWNAENPSSGAYGIPQSLPGHKMASAGKDWRTNPATQIRWGLGYIKGRYGSPSSALSFHDRNNWYDDGGMLPPGLLNGTMKPEPVLTEQQWNAILTNAQRGMDMPELHVYIGDQEITELVRVEMSERDRGIKRYVGAMGGGIGS